MVLHTYVLRVQYSCGIVVVFWFWQEIVFGVMYVLSGQYSCAVVSDFWLWQEIVLKMRTCTRPVGQLKQHARLSEACLVEATSDNDLSVEHNSMSN